MKTEVEKEESAENSDLCQTCNKNESTGLHTCPYAEELYGSDHECNCCGTCTHECAMDI